MIDTEWGGGVLSFSSRLADYLKLRTDQIRNVHDNDGKRYVKELKLELLIANRAGLILLLCGYHVSKFHVSNILSFYSILKENDKRDIV